MNTHVFLKTIPRALNWLALLTALLLLVKVFWLNDFTEPIRGIYQLGLVLEGVMASVLASYAFYLIVVHFKETRDRTIIYPHVLRWARTVVGDCQSQLAAFSKHTNHQASLQTLQLQDVEVMFKGIDPHSAAPLVFSLGNHANWIQYFEYHRNRTKRSIAKIMAQLIFLEAPLVARLTKIEDSTHFSIVEMLLNLPINNKDLSSFASTFYEYCTACKELDVYLSQHVHAEAV